ncbi:UNVERIFIED_CONTAM: Subtilisin-like protease SBT1.1 [Sesamum latifolium]|uniref:Subtilisin-like protease SBT1.1 n=1 Tax=Sesamum latifolium TaxID=2727402 RepID=A0AAW2YFP4_9LAMI
MTSQTRRAYPYYLTLLLSSNARNVTATYKRTVTNVGTPVSTYAVKVTEPEGVSIIVEPKILKFHKLGEKLSYKVRFTAIAEGTASANFSFGTLVWLPRSILSGVLLQSPGCDNQSMTILL